MNFEELFVDPRGRTALGPYLGGLVTLLAAAGFYGLLVPGRTGQFAMLILLFPALVLHARRLRALGHGAWWVLIPGVLLAAAAGFSLFAPEAGQARPLALAGWASAAGVILRSLIDKRPAAAES